MVAYGDDDDDCANKECAFLWRLNLRISYDFNIGVWGWSKKTSSVCGIPKVNLRIRNDIGNGTDGLASIQHLHIPSQLGADGGLKSTN